MQKKSHKRKFQVGQMVRVRDTPTTNHENSCVAKVVGITFKITEYKNNAGLNYLLGDQSYWFSAKELEAIQEKSPEEFFEEKETDGPIAQVLLNVLERMQIDAERNYNRDPKKYSSQYTCDLIWHFTSYSSLNEQVMFFLDGLGFDHLNKSFTKFSEFSEGFHRQSARFNWILFALQMAREQGV